MRILIVTSNFHPEPSGIGPYATDLARVLVLQGHEVFVQTTFPHYPWWGAPESIREGTPKFSVVDGIKVGRVDHFIPKKPQLASRLFFEFSMFINLLTELRKIRSKYELVIGITPSIGAGFAAKRIAHRMGSRFNLIVQDLSGLGVKQSGYTSSKLIEYLATRVEAKLIKSATSVSCISIPIKNFVENISPSSNTVYIPNYPLRDIDFIDLSIARKKFNFNPDEKIVMHIGNMGKKQNLEVLIDAARILVSNSALKFILVGHGNQERILRERAKDLTNVQFFPSVSDEDFPFILNSADIFFIGEKSSQTQMSLPSKLNSYLMLDKPIVSAVPNNGATSNYLDGCSYEASPENSIEVANAINLLFSNEVEYKVNVSKVKSRRSKLPTRDSAHRMYLNWISHDPLMQNQP